MNWKTGIAVSLLFVSAQISEVMAGVEPSPFQPQINQLGAVANILNSAEFRILMTMSDPPDACITTDPCKGLYGDVNRLEAINNQVSSAQYMVESMILEVMGVEPSPFKGDLVAPLQVVQEVAESIIGGIEAKIGEYGLGGNVPVEFIDALDLVSGSAARLVSTAEYGIKVFSQPFACGGIEDENVCNNTAGCVWIPGSVAPGYCAVSDVGN